jgi:hypothetical protein
LTVINQSVFQELRWCIWMQFLIDCRRFRDRKLEGIRELERTPCRTPSKNGGKHRSTCPPPGCSSYPPIAHYQAPIGQRPANSGR